MIKNIRFIVLLILLVASTYFLFSFFIFKPTGIIVVSLDENNKCQGIKEGSIITEMRGMRISSEEDFQDYVKNVKQGEYVSMVINNMPGGCIALNDSYLGITVRNVEKRGLKFGIDLAGGKISTFTSSQNLEKVKEILEKRIEVFKIPEATVSISDKTLKVITLKDEKLEPLLIEGNFETKIIEEVKLRNNTGKIPVGSEDYTITLEDGKIKVNESYYKQNETFILNSIEFEVKNITNSSVYIEALIFTKKDIKRVTYSFVKFEPSVKTYEFNIPVEISEEASERFSKVIDRMPTTTEAGTIVLNGRLIYYLDGKEMSNLAIPFSMVGRKITSISILGFRDSGEAATLDKNKIEASIRTENLEPVKLIKTEELRPRYEMFGVYSSAALVFLEILFSITTFFRYRKGKLSALLIILSLVQVFLIFGSIGISQHFIENSWLIDTSTIIGTLTIASLTLLQFILVLEKRVRKKELSLNYKLKKIINFSTLLNILVAISSFVLLFTFKTFGLSVFSGFLFGFLLLVPLYDEIARKST
ncbi:MAG: hypothetical protein ACP5O8_00705 [Candidatus Aenigmatarchaeota archaeon]